MFPEKEILLLYAESSLHAGAGSDVGYVDNPIQRERATGFPIIQSNGVKGALREFFETSPGCNQSKVDIIFGPEGQSVSGAGAVSFGEARVLLFPVRSLAGVFAYVTCPAVLDRFQRDLAACGKNLLGEKGKARCPAVGSGKCITHAESHVKADDDGIVLEEILFTIKKSPDESLLLETLAAGLCPGTPEYENLNTHLPKRIVILNDNDFAYFVSQTTEIEPHNRIDNEKGTVDEDIGVWYTEYLPSETVLYACLFIGRPRVGNSGVFGDAKEIGDCFVNGMKDQRVWIGGNRTTGKGRLMTLFWESPGNDEEKEETP